ncbi:hypothetical protein A2911_00270 [Candidatus Nomurabacteria bacterium RIFCSPLOWO2_01_FULL_40_15]|uniref:Uncharacterized protein n=1 Tax=Candidatus Nomurabacteria bacterium RIFCSPLOWO2_01_FULL_40_15 TaxID=1801772 RepID=A0A1F6X8R9_9BACT|nr:MAG: hypothetical protein A2911_00270 [Candidatus Nomurabacteria bacterium RIFCSPLOWO2_01_FULL_40_15]
MLNIILERVGGDPEIVGGRKWFTARDLFPDPQPSWDSWHKPSTKEEWEFRDQWNKVTEGRNKFRTWMNHLVELDFVEKVPNTSDGRLPAYRFTPGSFEELSLRSKTCVARRNSGERIRRQSQIEALKAELKKLEEES